MIKWKKKNSTIVPNAPEGKIIQYLNQDGIMMEKNEDGNEWVLGSPIYIVASSINGIDYIASSPRLGNNYPNGAQIIIKMDMTNAGGDCTLNVNSIGTIDIVNAAGSVITTASTLEDDTTYRGYFIGGELMIL